MAEHILDRPVWNSLDTVHKRFSVGLDCARRFESDINPLAAARDESDESLAQLAAILPVTGSIVVAQLAPIVCPTGARATFEAQGVQMTFDGTIPEVAGSHPVVRLTEADSPEMLELANLTRPGPFAARTYLLGEFWGVKQDGKLIAMAGERMKQPGYTELSGVCTRPDHQGKGLGRQLCYAVLRRIFGRNEIPYLHVFASNSRAIHLYEAMGFRERIRINVMQLERADIA